MSLRFSVNKYLKKLEKTYDTLNKVTISKSALLNNFDYFQSLVPNGYVIPVIKSNAYGHGIGEVSEILKHRRLPYLAVDGYFEALAIRNISKQPVLIMGAIDPNNFKSLKYADFAFVVHDEKVVRELGKTGKKINIHLELDTGMTRHGVTPAGLTAILNAIQKYKNLHLEGVMSHLADADNPVDNTYSEKQTAQFDDAVDVIRLAGFQPKYLHIAQSAGSTKVKSKYANTLRVGIALYGINPLASSDKNFKNLENLKPVLQLTSTITKILEVSKGQTVSYSRIFKAPKATKIGVLPLGYYEGLPRDLSNKGCVQFKNVFFPIAGRVCMNHTMVDVGLSNVNVGDKVIVYSSDKTSKVAIDNICREYGLFNYSVLVGINQNIKREIVK